MRADGVNVDYMQITVRGNVEIECAHCGTIDTRAISFDFENVEVLSPNDELRADAIRDAEKGGWKRTHIGVGRRSIDGGIVCPDCAAKLPS